MPRKTFLAHLKEARSANLPSTIAVEGGMNTGLFSFVYMSNYLPESSVVIQGEVPEVSDYPTRHDCFLFIDRDQNPPPVVPTTLSNLSVKGKSLLETLTIVATALDKALDPTSPIEISDSDEEHEDDFECDGNDNDGLSSESDTTANNIHSCTTRRTPSQSTAAKRIRSDLRAVKRGGFKFGILGDLSSTGIVCVSIRITKLGISEEAMKAWGLRRKQYLVLMIRFLDGYQPIDQVLDESTLSGKTQIRVGLCERYKPGFENATGMFTKLPAGSCDTVLTQKSETATLNESATTTNFPLEPLFIGGPINDLFKDRFASILRYRLTCAFPWSGAENFVHDVQGKNAADVNADDARYLARENMEGRTLPSIVVADTIEETISGVHLSFPLSAMQFLLRHFVRCTEFCLVCHCTVDTSFEALKPYVCSRPLCLYQYMALGFGPSIGWEIITQPYTVDMLVSFTYVSARSGLLRDFPTGIAMRIPLLPQLGMVNSGQYGYGTSYRQAMDTNSTQADMKCEKSFSAKLNRNNSELLIESKVIKTSPVRAGDWLVVQNVALDGSIHYRVADTALFPVIMLDGEGLFVANHKPETYKTTEPSLAQEATIPGYMNVDVFVYEHDFNELGISQRRNCITMLLDTLPGILKLREHLLSSNQGPDPQLRTRKHDLSDAALNLLRWIIASNRSCIMQVDRLTDKHAEGTASKSFTAEDRVSGMDDYMQFRFAQGAPDKESRFLECVNKVATRTNSAYPTIFAWHGSPIGNWHSIIREGLHFNSTLHGRAYGDGVYMSPHANTSLSYSTMPYPSGANSTALTWPNSELKISTTISLQEVVNCPTEFVSQTPHYVVNQLDWIQTRYLFVKTEANCQTQTSAPSLVFQQDKTRAAIGPGGAAVSIPITAVSKSRRPGVETKTLPNGSKKAKAIGITNQQSAEDAEDDRDSVISDQADREYLDSDMEDSYTSPAVQEEINNINSPRAKRPRDPDVSQTDFVPGSLDMSSIKILKQPAFATPQATKRLSKTLQELVKVQNGSKLHELGWWIDVDQVENLYQWIIELHSFDKTLPLADDMKKAGITSIVLEMRFTPSFPFFPPFVRVVRPRFLPFLSGGGGHVTAGGAICMQLLTNDGWLVTNSIESVLLQIRMAISSTDPRPARLESRGARYGDTTSSYSVGEAIDAFKRACRTHGWQIPEDIDMLAQQE